MLARKERSLSLLRFSYVTPPPIINAARARSSSLVPRRPRQLDVWDETKGQVASANRRGRSYGAWTRLTWQGGCVINPPTAHEEDPL